MKMFIRKHALLIALGTIVIAVTMFVVRVPFSVTAYGRLVPANEWTLVRGNDGQLIATLRNNITGTCDAYDASNPSTDSRVRFVLNQDILRRTHIRVGDTLGHVYLSDIEERLTELYGELDIAKATLAVAQSGDKDEVITEAMRELELAVAESVLQDKIVARMAALYSKDLVSLQEYEIAEGEAELLKLEKRIAQAQLEAVKAGAKPQQIDLLGTQIRALEREISGIRTRLASSAIISPVTGRLSRDFATDTLLIVSGTTACAALVPVRLADYQYALEAREIEISLGRDGVVTKARLMGWDQTVRVVGGEQTILASARLSECPTSAWSGMVVQCDFLCGSVTALEYLRRFFESAVG